MPSTHEPLFFTPVDPFSLFEKSAAIARMPDDEKRWPAQVLSEMHKQLPFLSKYDVDIELTRIDAEAGYALGYAIVRNKTGRQRAEEQLGKPTNRMRIPVIVSDRQLQPFHVFELGGTVYPLTQERVDAAMINPSMFDGAVDTTPASPSLVDQIYPPFQHRQGNGMASSDRQAAGLAKLSSARFATKTASGEPGPLREFLRREDFDKEAVNLTTMAAGKGIAAALKGGTLMKGTAAFDEAVAAARAAKKANPGMKVTRSQARQFPVKSIEPNSPLLKLEGMTLRTPEQGGKFLAPAGPATTPKQVVVQRGTGPGPGAPAPVTTAPVTTAPVTTAPVTTAPVTPIRDVAPPPPPAGRAPAGAPLPATDASAVRTVPPVRREPIRFAPEPGPVQVTQTRGSTAFREPRRPDLSGMSEAQRRAYLGEQGVNPSMKPETAQTFLSDLDAHVAGGGKAEDFFRYNATTPEARRLFGVSMGNRQVATTAAPAAGAAVVAEGSGMPVMPLVLGGVGGVALGSMMNKQQSASPLRARLLQIRGH